MHRESTHRGSGRTRRDHSLQGDDSTGLSRRSFATVRSIGRSEGFDGPVRSDHVEGQQTRKVVVVTTAHVVPLKKKTFLTRKKRDWTNNSGMKNDDQTSSNVKRNRSSPQVHPMCVRVKYNFVSKSYL